MTGRHGAVHPPREGAGQPFSVTCPESASRRFRTVPASSVEAGGFLPACSIQGGNTTGVTHEAAKRWVPERSKTRIRRTGCGSSSSHAVGAPVNTPSRARDGVAHPPSSGRSSLSRRVRLLPQSAGVTAETADPRVVGTVSGVVHGRPVESCSEASGYSRRIAVRHGGPGRGRSACPSHPRGGRASPSHHDRQPWCDAGPGASGPPRTIRMDGGIRRFGDARPTARWCNGSTPAPVAGGPGSNPEAGADAHTIRSPTIP